MGREEERLKALKEMRGADGQSWVRTQASMCFLGFSHQHAPHVTQTKVHPSANPANPRAVPVLKEAPFSYTAPHPALHHPQGRQK